MMKRALLLSAIVLAGCSASPKRVAPLAPAVQAPANDINVVQRVPFRIGTSSNTVEQMGKAQGCASTQGAGLVTEPGPVEVYRMQCENGTVFMARCELRECRKM